MSDDIITQDKQDQLSIVPGTPQYVPVSENVYDNIAETLDALENVCIDGESINPIPTSLLANSFKKLIPDTEIGMKLSQALPMSDADIKAVQIKMEVENSLESRKAKISATSKTLKDLTGARIRVAYRLCRYMSQLLGMWKQGEPSIFSMAGNIPGLNMYEMPIPFDPYAGLIRGMTTPRLQLEDITNSQFEYTYIAGTGNDEQLFRGKGMSVLPPPLHDGYYPDPPFIYRKQMYTPPDYDPKQDVPLAFYLNIMEFLVNHLEIGSSTGGGAFTGIGTTMDKKPRTQNIDDRSAVLALLNPNIARLAWPCRDDLETFEEYVLIPHVEELLVDQAPMDVCSILKEEMGLTHPEAEDYMEVAKTYAREAHNFDPDRERSILVNKVHKLAARCGDAGMVSTELKSLMSVSQLLHLTKHVEDTNIDKRAGLKSALEERMNAGKVLDAGDINEA